MPFLYPYPFTTFTLYAIPFTCILQQQTAATSLTFQKGSVAEGKYQVIWIGKNYLDIENPNGMHDYPIHREFAGKKSDKIVLIK